MTKRNFWPQRPSISLIWGAWRRVTSERATNNFGGAFLFFASVHGLRLNKRSGLKTEVSHNAHFGTDDKSSRQTGSWHCSFCHEGFVVWSSICQSSLDILCQKVSSRPYYITWTCFHGFSKLSRSKGHLYLSTVNSHWYAALLPESPCV